MSSVQLMGVGVYGGKDFWKNMFFSLEWKSDGWWQWRWWRRHI